MEVFSTDASLNLVDSAVSDTITNSKSKECGPLQLHDVNPTTSCTEGKVSGAKFLQHVFAPRVKLGPAFGFQGCTWLLGV
jgi:hypothetical protein